jgi:diaminohydroxyphosphoribosylaminopyrimidine deaminase/5-amino-6-(5-phosphoribosylamino)uracil reductase
LENREYTDFKLPMKKDHLYYMGLALEEAKKGIGRVSPNPAVGAIIVKEGKIVGRGYHKKAGTPHAEVHAIRDAGQLAKDATLYVTLEPCNHTGRTPPCTEAIIRAGITSVVIGMLDPNPSVIGGGADYLKTHGVAISYCVIEQQCKELNHPFFKHSVTGLPWIIMKAGLSLDGRISFSPKQGAALTGFESGRYVHQIRNQVDAILIGVETALVEILCALFWIPAYGYRPMPVCSIKNHLRKPGCFVVSRPPRKRSCNWCRAGQKYFVCRLRLTSGSICPSCFVS